MVAAHPTTLRLPLRLIRLIRLMMRRRVVLLASIVAIVVVSSACRTTVTVDIDVAENGSGTVTVTADLDTEASNQLGDPSKVSFADLEAAGWTVDAPADLDDGGVRFRVVRRFDSADQLPTVLDEVGGTDGVFRDVSLSLTDSFARSSSAFDARVELTGTVDQFTDDELTAALGGLPFGRTPEELEALGANATGSGVLDVSVALPGGTPGTNGTVDGDRATWSFPLTGGPPTSEDLQAETTTTDVTTLALVAGGALAVLLGLVALVIGLLRRRRRPDPPPEVVSPAGTGDDVTPGP